jgi:hypothetical protein
MSVNTISFGKVTLVNAPYNTAEQIAHIANSRNKTDLGKQVKTIINDTKHGKAYAYPAFNLENQSYIFSGKEGKTYSKSFREACDRVEYAHDYYTDKKIAGIDMDFTWRLHDQNAREIVNSAKNISVMDVEYTKLGDIKSVNLIA